MEVTENKSWKTAITRKSPSCPLTWIDTQYVVFTNYDLRRRISEKGWRMLDYGCGRGYDAKWLGCDRYDPYWHPAVLKNKYDIILCTYVLNVVEREDQWEILNRLNDLIIIGGTTYVTVRRDLDPLADPQRDGYVQRHVLDEDMREFGYRSIRHEKGSFEIYAKGPVPTLENS